MSNWREAQQGGFIPLSDEALPSISSSTQVFANAPATAAKAVVTLRVAAVTARFTGSAATAGANGHDFAVGTYTFYGNQENLKKVRMIQNGGTTTGYITYYGVRS